MAPVNDAAIVAGHRQRGGERPCGPVAKHPRVGALAARRVTLVPMQDVHISVIHRRRLRDVYRSAGWPSQDGIEIELLAAGLLARERGPLGHETLRVTDAGIAVLAETLQRNRARRGAHEALVDDVAQAMTRAGRLAWRGLSARAKVRDAWTIAMPDVFSIRHTSVEAYLEPVVHEIKVQRSDLLADLRRSSKREAYLQLAGECWYVIRAGIAEPDEIPAECGVMVAAGSGFDVLRAAPKRPTRMTFPLWMALARATPLAGWRADESQAALGQPDADRAEPSGSGSGVPPAAPLAR